MKKILSNFIVLCVTTLIGLSALSCSSTSYDVQKENEFKAKASKYGYEGETGMIENATPENSVLVYGWSVEPYVYLYYADAKSDWQTVQRVGGEFVLPPVHKGAELEIRASEYEFSNSSGAGGTVYHNHYHYEITNKEWNVKVPKDKSLYFMGIHSIRYKNFTTWKTIQETRAELGTIMIGYPKTEDEYDAWYKKTYTNTEKACLKKLLKKYKGTAWEPLIKERMDELSE